MPVLVVIFFQQETNRYKVVLQQIEQEQASGKMPKRPLKSADFLKRCALMLPKEARYDELASLPTGADLGKALVEAMNAVEKEFESLSGQLPKDYERFDNSLLETL